MAAPHVAGTAALVWTANPGLTYAQVKNKILNGSRYWPQLDGERKISGGRLLDMAGALSAAP
jgi:subtilisin family serine protease